MAVAVIGQFRMPPENLERAREAVVIMTTHLADELAPHAAQTLRVENGKVLTA